MILPALQAPVFRNRYRSSSHFVYYNREMRQPTELRLIHNTSRRVAKQCDATQPTHASQVLQRAGSRSSVHNIATSSARARTLWLRPLSSATQHVMLVQSALRSLKMSTPNDETRLLLVIALYLRRRRRRRGQRSVWVRPILRRRRRQQGEFHNLLLEMRLTDSESHFQYLRMTKERFDSLLSKVGGKIGYGIQMLY